MLVCNLFPPFLMTEQCCPLQSRYNLWSTWETYMLHFVVARLFLWAKVIASGFAQAWFLGCSPYLRACILIVKIQEFGHHNNAHWNRCGLRAAQIKVHVLLWCSFAPAFNEYFEDEVCAIPPRKRSENCLRIKIVMCSPDWRFFLIRSIQENVSPPLNCRLADLFGWHRSASWANTTTWLKVRSAACIRKKLCLLHIHGKIHGLPAFRKCAS